MALNLPKASLKFIVQLIFYVAYCVGPVFFSIYTESGFGLGHMLRVLTLVLNQDIRHLYCFSFGGQSRLYGLPEKV